MIRSAARSRQPHHHQRHAALDEPALPVQIKPLPPVVVGLSPRLANRLDELAGAFGAGYCVTIAPDDRAQVAVIPSAPSAAISEYRRRHPASRIVVFDPGPEVDPVIIASCFDAGADAFVAQPSLEILAAHIQAVIRRPAPGARQ